MPKLLVLLGQIDERKRHLRYSARSKELGQRYGDYLNSVPALDVSYPTTSELLKVPEIDSLLREDGSNIVVSETRFQESFIAHVEASRRTLQAALIREFISKSRVYLPPDQLLATIELSDDDLVQMHGDVFEYATFFMKSCQFSPYKDSDEYLLCHYSQAASSALLLETIRRDHLSVDIKVASAILAVLNIPNSIYYQHIDYKVLCLCAKADFDQPATFTNLVRR